ncbi:MAG: thioredoxin [Brevinematales bacterium]|nr:thioredoxin [Brevinematales bacterium]
MSNLVSLKHADFDKEVVNSSMPVLLDFWAEWCPPCRMIAPLLEQLSDEYKDKVKIMKVNVDEEPELATQFGITNIPTLLFFKAGNPYEKIVGAVPKQKIKDILDKMLG